MGCIVNKRSYPVWILTGLLAVVAVAAYLMPEASAALPVRVPLANKGGLVVFDHTKHAADYAISCETCHHESEEAREDVLPCGTCHGLTFDENFRTTHMETITDPMACVKCHHTNSLPEPGEPIPVADFTGCNEEGCHEETPAELIPDRMQAFHQQCMSCHETEKKGPFQPDQCNQCHTK